MKNLNFKKIFLVFFITIFCNIGFAQVSTYTFIDPCTKEVTNFSVPLQGGKTMIIFLNKIGYFDANDLSNGSFTNWVNQVYTVYRQTNPCSQQQGQVTQNQITTQIISGTIQSLVGSILANNQVQSSNTESGSVNAGGNDAGDKDNKNSDKKKNKSKSDGNNNSSGGVTNGSTNQNGGQPQSNSGTTNQNGGSGDQQGSGTPTNNTTTPSTGNSTTGGGSTTQPPVNSNTNTSTNTNTNTSTTNGGGKTDEKPPQNKTEEVGTSLTMNVDAHNDNGGGSNSGGKGNGRANPVIISSDITSAQNLDKTFTPIINIGTSKSSMTGLSSFGVTGMVWLNFNQFAVSGRYTKIHYNKSKKLKFIHNLNLTGVYTYGNYLGFIGYSGIINGGKYGITGFNVSAAATVISMEKSGYYSPSITAFYTRPFKIGKKLIVSPELYVISTPLVYSTKEKVSITDRYISGFVGSGFDYQISKRFKVNVNYKANLSTNPDFPVLSFFLIGSKVNL